MLFEHFPPIFSLHTTSWPPPLVVDQPWQQLVLPPVWQIFPTLQSTATKRVRKSSRSKQGSSFSKRKLNSKELLQVGENNSRPLLMFHFEWVGFYRLCVLLRLSTAHPIFSIQHYKQSIMHVFKFFLKNVHIASKSLQTQGFSQIRPTLRKFQNSIRTT